jgi:hypothetical protein
MKFTHAGTVNLNLTHAVILVVILSCLLAACGNPKAGSVPTNTALATQAPQPSSTPAPTDTPIPTSTSTPLPTETPTKAPTKTPTPDLMGTEVANAVLQAAEIADQIAPVLDKLGFSPEDGSLAWYNGPPISIRIFDYNAAQIFQLGDDLNVEDFILSTDITWESSLGYAVCGIIFRAEPDITDGEYYIFQSMRLSGLPAWDIEFWDNNQYITAVSGGVQTNRAIQLDQGSTNSFMLVVQGDKMTAYANGTRLRTQYDTHRADGLLALFAWQESGETTCTFSDTWVWALN